MKKPDYGLQLHTGMKIVLFEEMFSSLLKQKLNCLAMMAIVMFGGKRGRLASKEHHPNREARGWQHHVVEVLLLQEGRVHHTRRQSGS